MKTLREECLQIIGTHKTTLFVLAVMWSLYYIWLMNYLFIFPKESPSWLWLQLLLFTFTIFSCRRWKLATLVWLSGSMLFLYADKIKCDLLLFPITEMDLKILFKNPVGFLDAVGISRDYQYTAASAGALTGGYLVQKQVRSLLRRDRRGRVIAELGVRALLVAISSGIISRFYLDYGAYIFENSGTIFEKNSLWSPEGMIKASKQLSTIGFLSYSHSADNQKSYGFINKIAPAYRAADKRTIETVAAKYLPPPGSNNRVLPNIVFILAESTFNPNAAFRLNKVVENSLFTPRGGELGGMLHVSAIGGGTWKTEFETVTGIDSRLFGFAGEYTHVSLSPFVKKSFATYLEEKGYDTRVLYPVRGNFYGARNAYLNYGFNHFDDALDLNLELNWTKFSDEQLATKVNGRIPENLDKPFFYYLLTLEGHSPYFCNNFTPSSVFPIQLSEDADFNKNCKLNEFILKIASTERAIASIVQRLRTIEDKTGRPFVVVIFGDHQPIDLVNDMYNKNRNKLSQNHTFYKIVKSESISLPTLKREFHSTLIPSLISTTVSDRADQIYLPENFYVYEKCGQIADLETCSDLSVLTKAYREYIKGDWFN